MEKFSQTLSANDFQSRQHCELGQWLKFEENHNEFDRYSLWYSRELRLLTVGSNRSDTERFRHHSCLEKTLKADLRFDSKLGLRRYIFRTRDHFSSLRKPSNDIIIRLLPFGDVPNVFGRTCTSFVCAAKLTLYI